MGRKVDVRAVVAEPTAQNMDPAREGCHSKRCVAKGIQDVHARVWAFEAASLFEHGVHPFKSINGCIPFRSDMKRW